MRHNEYAKTLIAPVIILLLTTTTTAIAAVPIHAWGKKFGGTSSDLGNSVAVDASGNVYVAGIFNLTADFGGGPLVSAGGNDVFLAKYNANGIHQWSRRFGYINNENVAAVAVDGSGNVFITGRFTGSASFGGTFFTSAGAEDIYVAKYTTLGVHVWSKQLGSTGSDFGNSVAGDAAGNVFLVGYFTGTVDFGGGGLMSAGMIDMFVAKYSAAGVHQWSKRFGAADNDIASSIAIDGSGDVCVTGTFGGNVDFGGGVLNSAGAVDIVLVKFNSGGTHLWSRRFGSTGNDRGASVQFDGSNNVVATGFFTGTVDFGGGGLLSAGDIDIFLAKFDGAGTHQWSRRFGGTSSDIGEEVATDASGNVLLAGWFYGTSSFGGGNFTVAGLYDGFVAEYDAAGTHVWSRQFASSNWGQAYGVAAHGVERAIVTGNFNGTANVGGGVITSGGAEDVVMAKYAPANPAITAITDIGNDQGRRVQIGFTRSGYDYPILIPVLKYEVFLRDDPLPSLVATTHLAMYSDAELLAEGWLQVASIPAHAEESYQINAPTDADSTITNGQHYSTFFIRAATTTPAVFYDSSPDSGYSLDNLPPGVPANFEFNAGVLAWDASSAADFDYFTVYGANNNDFGLATVVDYTVTPTMNVTASPYAYYYLTATDFSGNEGNPGSVSTLTGTDGTPASYVLSVTNYPNPFNPSTHVKYTVPAPGMVTVAIYDARGARVATLVSRQHDAGAYSIEWRGRSDAGAAVSSGVYFARIEHGSAVRSKKMVLIK